MFKHLILMWTVAAVLTLSTACSGSAEVTADDYGAAWPLKLDQATLHCNADGLVLLMNVGDHMYALTGFTRIHMARHFPDLMLSPLSQVQIQGRSIGPLIDRTKELCG